MKKNAYYFSHDFNANSDVKILFMRQQLGMEGYGIYWFLVESLADAGGYLPLKIVPVLAMQMQVPEVKVTGVICQFDLFKIVDDEFYSDRLNTHLEQVKQLKDKKSKAGKISAEIRKNKQISTGVEQVLDTRRTDDEHLFNKGKEKKGKEKKEKENNGDFFSEIFSGEKIVGTKENISKLFPKNHPKFGESAIKISDDKKFAIFEDGFEQEIGDNQSFYSQPNLIKRGFIY